jgi:hypothetical protein
LENDNRVSYVLLIGAVVIGFAALAVVVRRIFGPRGFRRYFGIYCFAAAAGGIVAFSVYLLAGLLAPELFSDYVKGSRKLLSQVVSRGHVITIQLLFIWGSLIGLIYCGMTIGAVLVWRRMKHPHG